MKVAGPVVQGRLTRPSELRLEGSPLAPRSQPLALTATTEDGKGVQERRGLVTLGKVLDAKQPVQFPMAAQKSCEDKPEKALPNLTDVAYQHLRVKNIEDCEDAEQALTRLVKLTPIAASS